MESEERKDKRQEVREAIHEASDEARAQHHEQRNKSIRKTNRLRLWLGVLILCIILIWWLFGIGTAEDAVGVINGN